MSVVELFPRLSDTGVDLFLENEDLTKGTAPDMEDLVARYRAHISFAPSGGHFADLAPAMKIGDSLRNLAARFGFPGTLGQAERAGFDQEASIMLGQHDSLDSAEALRDDVWAFMTTIAASDVVSWRFSDRSSERFRGGVRNTFQRLWLRGKVLDRGPDSSNRWALIRNLSEDAMVQIFERPAIGAHRRVALTLAECWLRTAEKVPREKMEKIMRTATKLVRLRNEIADLSSLSDQELEEVMMHEFRISSRNIYEEVDSQVTPAVSFSLQD